MQPQPLLKPSAEPLQPVKPTDETGQVSAPTLWLCVRFQKLCLESLAIEPRAQDPIGIVEEENPRARVLDATDGALRCGIKLGMPATAAYALLPTLTLLRRDRNKERAALTRLAAWAQRFSPRVSLSTPNVLLMEVRGSLHLFGGAEALCARVKDELGELGHQVHLALAPSGRAALWLACAGRNVVMTNPSELAGILGTLPLADLPWPQKRIETLRRLGITTLREVFRLPRKGLLRRLGQELVHEWDQALGHAPELHDTWRAAARFTAAQELPLETSDTSYLLAHTQPLLEKFCDTLQQHDAIADALTLTLHHRNTPPTVLRISLMQPCRSLKTWLNMLELRLERIALSAPVAHLHIASETFQPAAPVTTDLFGSAQSRFNAKRDLLDRLRARLGQKAVFSLACTGDQRPEYAWRHCEPNAASSAADAALVRPLWLLQIPQRLQVHGKRPCDGPYPLDFEQGPERLESGWWQNADIARDYYIARHPNGSHWWVYRERGHGNWFLHGLFA